MTCSSLSSVGLSGPRLGLQRKTLQYLSERFPLAPACAGPFHPAFLFGKRPHHGFQRTPVSFLFPASASQPSNFILPCFKPKSLGIGGQSFLNQSSRLRFLSSLEEGIDSNNLTGNCSAGHKISLAGSLIKVSVRTSMISCSRCIWNHRGLILLI